MIHNNRHDSYNHGQDGPFGKRAKAIISKYAEHPNTAFRDREIKTKLGFEDMNSVRPRITELVKLGVLMECGSMEDPVTGMTVRLVRLTQKQGKLV